MDIQEAITDYRERQEKLMEKQMLEEEQALVKAKELAKPVLSSFGIEAVGSEKFQINGNLCNLTGRARLVHWKKGIETFDFQVSVNLSDEPETEALQLFITMPSKASWNTLQRVKAPLSEENLHGLSKLEENYQRELLEKCIHIFGQFKNEIRYLPGKDLSAVRAQSEEAFNQLIDLMPQNRAKWEELLQLTEERTKEEEERRALKEIARQEELALQTAVYEAAERYVADRQAWMAACAATVEENTKLVKEYQSQYDKPVMLNQLTYAITNGGETIEARTCRVLNSELGDRMRVVDTFGQVKTMQFAFPVSLTELATYRPSDSSAYCLTMWFEGENGGELSEAYFALFVPMYASGTFEKVVAEIEKQLKPFPPRPKQQDYPLLEEHLENRQWTQLDADGLDSFVKPES